MVQSFSFSLNLHIPDGKWPVCSKFYCRFRFFFFYGCMGGRSVIFLIAYSHVRVILHHQSFTILISWSKFFDHLASLSFWRRSHFLLSYLVSVIILTSWSLVLSCSSVYYHFDVMKSFSCYLAHQSVILKTLSYFRVILRYHSVFMESFSCYLMSLSFWHDIFGLFYIFCYHCDQVIFVLTYMISPINLT